MFLIDDKLMRCVWNVGLIFLLIAGYFIFSYLEFTGVKSGVMMPFTGAVIDVAYMCLAPIAVMELWK